MQNCLTCKNFTPCRCRPDEKGFCALEDWPDTLISITICENYQEKEE